MDAQLANYSSILAALVRQFGSPHIITNLPSGPYEIIAKFCPTDFDKLQPDEFMDLTPHLLTQRDQPMVTLTVWIPCIRKVARNSTFLGVHVRLEQQITPDACYRTNEYPKEYGKVKMTIGLRKNRRPEPEEFDVKNQEIECFVEERCTTGGLDNFVLFNEVIKYPGLYFDNDGKITVEIQITFLDPNPGDFTPSTSHSSGIGDDSSDSRSEPNLPVPPHMVERAGNGAAAGAGAQGHDGPNGEAAGAGAQ